MSLLAGCVDEIIVVDTGSSDSTPDIARANGAKLLNFAWHDDFAAARNYGLAAATGDWILYIDADERLVETSRETLLEGLADERAYAARLLFRLRLNGTWVREYRLFRNDPRLRFKGAMHETIRPDLDALRDLVGALTVESPARMIHLGYEGDLTAKHRRNLPLLEAAVTTTPDRLYYWNHLAETLGALGETERAIATADAALTRSEHRTDPESQLMRAALATTSVFYRLAAGREALPTIELGLRLRPGDPTLTFLKAKALVELARYDAALEIIGDLTSMDGEVYFDPDVSHDRRIFSTYAHDLAGLALLRSGRQAEAADAFARAARTAPEEPSYRVKALALGIAAV